MAHTVLFQNKLYRQGVICLNEHSEVIGCQSFEQEIPLTRFYEGLLFAVAPDFREVEFRCTMELQLKSGHFQNTIDMLLANDWYRHFADSLSMKYDIYQLIITEPAVVSCRKIS